jgi:hypothetical protein
MSSRLPPRRRGRGKNEETPDRAWPPAKSLFGNAWCEATLFVDLASHFVQAADDRLDLDHEHGSPRRLAGEDVDRTALAIAGVRHLDGGFPAEAHQPLDHEPNDPSVLLVEKDVDRGPASGNRGVEPRVEHREDPPKRVQRQSIEVATLDERDRRLADAAR